MILEDLEKRYRVAKESGVFSEAVINSVINYAVKNKSKYEEVSQATGFHWCVIACIHALESSQNFTRHLHNGDPLTSRTVQVPAGRPRSGTPPFTWVESAIDALDSYRSPKTLGEVLDFLERYNGLGYRTGAGRATTPPSTSPYLWSGTNQYIKGKYVADGTFNPNAVSQQIGAVILLKNFEELNHIKFEGAKDMKNVTWWELFRTEEKTRNALIGYDGSTPILRVDTNSVDEMIKVMGDMDTAKTFLVAQPNKAIPKIEDAPTPSPTPTPTPTPVPKDMRKKILEVAIERCSKGRAHSPGNIIDVEVLDPLRAAMIRLGQMSASDQDGFWNWCSANITKIIRQAGFIVPDQPIVNGRPFWATVALVETYKAWAISKEAWRPWRQSLPGDIVIFDWDANGVTDHIGIITEVRSDGVVSAEGNKANREAILFRQSGFIAGSINIEKLLS